MNNSKKLLYVKLVVALVMLLFASLFIFIIVKINIVGDFFDDKTYIRSASASNLDKYIDDINNREYNIRIRDKRIIEETKKEKEEIVVDNSIFKYINNIKEKKNKSGVSVDNKLKDTNQSVSIKDKDIRKEIDKIQKIYDKGYYQKNSWIIIDEDNDFYGYNYFFNNEGKLIFDTVTTDYKIVDKYGREVNDDLEPIIYEIKTVETQNNEESKTNQKKLNTSQVIVTENVEFNKKTEYYDNKMNRKVLDYIDIFLRFKKTTRGIIYNGSKWEKVSAIKNNGGYVIFNNPNNNFNKIIGKITTEDMSGKENIYLTLYVYDADLYEMYEGYEYMIEPLYETSAFNYTEPLNFNFSFFRTVKRLRFQIDSNGDNRLTTCYLKDLRYGFDKVKYKEELEEAKDREEYIAYLKELGLYKSDEEILAELKTLEENTTNDYLEYIDFYENVDLSDLDKNIDTEQRVIDKSTGPAFDEYLRSLKNYWEIGYGPGYK